MLALMANGSPYSGNAALVLRTFVFSLSAVISSSLGNAWFKTFGWAAVYSVAHVMPIAIDAQAIQIKLLSGTIDMENSPYMVS